MTKSQRSWGVMGIPIRELGPRRVSKSVRRAGVWLTLTLLAAVVVCAAVLPLQALGASRPEAATVFAHLPWGSGDAEVGLIQAKEGLTRGPEDLAVAPDGRVAILDSVNGRLLLLDPAGGSSGTIELDLAQPRFLAVDDQALYVLDSDVDKKLVTYSWSGELTASASPPQVRDLVTGLFATSEGPCVELAHRDSWLVGGGSVRMLPGRPLGRGIEMVAAASFRPSEGLRLSARSLTGKGDPRIADEVELRPTLASGNAIEHLVSIDSDGHGGVLVGARFVEPQARGKVDCSLAITRLPSSGTGEGRGGPRAIQDGAGAPLLLSESDFAYIGEPYTVSPEGTVFQPVADESGYTILIHTLEEVRP